MNLQPLQDRDPRQIGKYTIVGRLGQGGMGQVYLGRTQGGRDVALKVIRDEFANNPEFRDRFRTEVAAARLVNGVYTAGVLDADPEAAVPWMATAFVAGPSLLHVVQQQPLSEPGVQALAAALSEALVSIHEVGVIHRDLKPTNVIMAPDGPRVIDFGIARAAEAVAVTAAGVVVGTPGFMAPEQVTGGHITPATDVFALGAVLAYAAMGVGAFGPGPSSALLYRVVHLEPELSSIQDQDLRELLSRCLDKDPAQRPTPEQVLARTGSSAPSSLLSPHAVDSDRAAPTPGPREVETRKVSVDQTRRVQDPLPTRPAAALAVAPRRRIARRIVAAAAATGSVLLTAGVVSSVALVAAGLTWGPDLLEAVSNWLPDVPGIDL